MKKFSNLEIMKKKSIVIVVNVKIDIKCSFKIINNHQSFIIDKILM